MPHTQTRVANQGHAPCLPGTHRVEGLRLLCDGGAGHALDHCGQHGRCVWSAAGSVDDPVAVGPHHRVVRIRQASAGVRAGRRPQRRPESLVAPLVQGEQPVHRRIGGVGRIPLGAAVDCQCAQHGSAGTTCVADQVLEPVRRDQVEQRRRRDELGQPDGDAGQATTEIGADGDQFGDEPGAFGAQPCAIAVADVEPVAMLICPPDHGLR